MVMGVEAVRNCDEADTSALPIDMDSGMLDSLFVSLNIDQNLFNIKGGKEIFTARLNHFFNVSS
jgi:hypothetical protein